MGWTGCLPQLMVDAKHTLVAARADRDAGRANGAVGTILAIEDRRVTVALDSKPGAERTLSFTVGADEAAGEFNHFRLGMPEPSIRARARRSTRRISITAITGAAPLAMIPPDDG